MSRKARAISKSGFMHVIVRGIGKQILFEDYQDYMFYLSILEKYCVQTGVSVCAYCLMENHVHLLLKESDRGIPLLMKKIGVSYSWYYNNKYERTGHLFQDRYLSEPVETEAYLKTVFRYILRNPQKAGICAAKDFKWSSYTDYGKQNSFVDTTPLENLIGPWEDYKKYIECENDDCCMEFIPTPHDDKWALNIILRQLDGKSGTALQSYSRPERNEVVKKLKNAGLTAPQIERLTGISRGVVYKVCCQKRIKKHEES